MPRAPKANSLPFGSLLTIELITPAKLATDLPVLIFPLTLEEMASSQPYKGTTRKLVLAFDVGTTFSGIGYAILDPGEVPKIQGVTRHVHRHVDKSNRLD